REGPVDGIWLVGLSRHRPRHESRRAGRAVACPATVAEFRWHARSAGARTGYLRDAPSTRPILRGSHYGPAHSRPGERRDHARKTAAHRRRTRFREIKSCLRPRARTRPRPSTTLADSQPKYGEIGAVRL